MIRLAALAELCLLAWGLLAVVSEELANRLGPGAIETVLAWLRWLGPDGIAPP